MSDSIVTVRGLTQDGYSNGRCVFVLKSADNFVKVMQDLILDKSMTRIYTTVREVQYA